MAVVATAYLAVGDHSVKPGDVVSEAPFNFTQQYCDELVQKGQANRTEGTVVEPKADVLSVNEPVKRVNIPGPGRTVNRKVPTELTSPAGVTVNDPETNEPVPFNASRPELNDGAEPTPQAETVATDAVALQTADTTSFEDWDRTVTEKADGIDTKSKATRTKVR